VAVVNTFARLLFGKMDTLAEKLFWLKKVGKVGRAQICLNLSHAIRPI
jgi:hypothetical protein